MSQRQVPEVLIIFEPKLELSMSNSNRYKSHPGGSDRHLHEPVQEVFHGLKGKILGNVPTNMPRSYELIKNPEKAPQRGGNGEILQWMEHTIIQTSNQNEGGKQGICPSSFYQKATSQPTSPRREEEKGKEVEETIIPKLEDTMDNVFKIVRALMEFKDKEEQRMRQPHFPKK
ncbi:hypothetical protein O181_037334 [Austropuccinia psidii MF-1]|uniref:Uncharacterized protein n=1 Tax=Austropuccinia psidii MF-1 TaxID=1389203 RepID=A0A9Q3HCG0_9BASI|nr:hypothetical protein [Austropuccinia psidii MF-1]